MGRRCGRYLLHNPNQKSFVPAYFSSGDYTEPCCVGRQQSRGHPVQRKWRLLAWQQGAVLQQWQICPAIAALTVYNLDTIFDMNGNKSAHWTSWQHVPAAVRSHTGPYRLSFEADCKSMSVLDAQGCIWNSQSWRTIMAPVRLNVQDDGSLVLKGSNGVVAWTR